jgi:hypothetical protein
MPSLLSLSNPMPDVPLVTNTILLVTNTMLLVTNTMLLVTNTMLLVTNTMLLVTNTMLLVTNTMLLVTNTILLPLPSSDLYITPGHSGSVLVKRSCSTPSLSYNLTQTPLGSLQNPIPNP